MYLLFFYLIISQKDEHKTKELEKATKLEQPTLSRYLGEVHAAGFLSSKEDPDHRSYKLWTFKRKEFEEWFLKEAIFLSDPEKQEVLARLEDCRRKFDAEFHFSLVNYLQDPGKLFIIEPDSRIIIFQAIADAFRDDKAKSANELESLDEKELAILMKIIYSGVFSPGRLNESKMTILKATSKAMGINFQERISEE
jgi:DNA-binding MarR family transcriptional regulator